jgi:hypothetical protein
MARNFNSAASEYMQNTNAVVDGLPVAVSVWFTLDDVETTNTKSLVNIGDVSTTKNRWRLYLLSGRTLSMRARNDDATIIQATAPSTLTTGQWYHGFGSISSGGSITTWVTDTSGSTVGGGNTITNNFVAFSDTIIGAHINGGAVIQEHNGNIAEVGLWNVELTESEKTALSRGYAPFLVRPQSLSGYWPLAGRTSPEIDIVGKYNMTLTNSPTTAAHPRIIYPKSGIVQVPPPRGFMSLNPGYWS